MEEFIGPGKAEANELIPTRAALIGRLKDWRDHASWELFYETYWRFIFRVATKSGLTEAESDDVVQETMISVAKQMPHFEYDPAIGSFKAWLSNLVRWRIADQFRKRRPNEEQLSPVVEAALTDESDGTLFGMESEWETNLLEAAVYRVKHRIDPEKYQIFDTYVKKGSSPEKVAQLFGISVDQVYMAKHRITELLKKEVERIKNEMV